MDRGAYWQIIEKSMEPAALECSTLYLAEHLGKVLKKGEPVLICFFAHKWGNLSWLMEQAVLRCGAVPVIWGPDHRWQTLLRQAFSSRASTIIGPPLVILGLTKLKKYNATPLYIRKAITAGYPCPNWMIEGIVKGLDCEVGGCFTLGYSAVVAGFACGYNWGVHIRDAEYGVQIVDKNGVPLPPGALGEIVLYPKAYPHLRYPMGENAQMADKACLCGSSAPQLLNISHGRNEPDDLAVLGQHLQSWTSVLDCRLAKGESGLEMELVCFPGEKLPQLPTAAKRIIRPWDPRTDEPFPYPPTLKNPENSQESH